MSVSPSYLGLLRSNVEFRRLWMGVLASFFGDWFATIALYAIAQELTDSAQAVATILIAKTLPIFLVSPIAGPLIDRFDRRSLMIATDLARSVTTVGIIAGYLAGSFAVVVVMLVLQVGFSGLFIPARTAVIPQLTSDDELPVAMALSGGTWSVMLAVGAAVGGLVTAGIGIVGSLAVDGVTFLISAAFLWGLPPLAPQTEGGADGATLVEGFRFLKGKLLLPAILCSKAGISLAAASLVALPLYGNGLFLATAGPAFTGLLFASRGLGALIGSLGVRKLVGDDSLALARMLPPAYLWSGSWLAFAAFAPNIGWAAFGYFASTIGNATVWVFSGILAQRRVPQGLRGRLFALEFGLLTLISAGSSWVAGMAMDLGGLTPRDINLAAGAILLLPSLAWIGVLSRQREPMT